MFKEISIDYYLESKQKVPLIDVRSPKEYAHAHMPGAINLPLFDDAERAVVGTLYKQEGQEKAILAGLEIVSPKIVDFVKQAKALESKNGIIIHCWRGGMRSKSMATLFGFAGIKTDVIKGGYKNYRRAVRKCFEENYHIIILGGKTGSAKTKILHALEEQGEQIIDLEKLANHKGSAFGSLGEQLQPTTEMFENTLFEALKKLDSKKRIWVEDESHLIGSVFIPEAFWKQMRQAPVVNCSFPLQERISYLAETYGNFDREKIIEAVKKIAKRLGGQHVKAAIENYDAGNINEAIKIVLVYYDKTYIYGISTRNTNTIYTIEMKRIEPIENARNIRQTIQGDILQLK